MNDSKLNFIVFSDDWGRHPSSCQHIFKRISKDHRVLWVNTIGLRAPKADAFTLWRGWEKIRQWIKPLKRIHENLWVFSPLMLPTGGSGLLGRLNVKATVTAIRRVVKKLKMDHPILWTTLPTARDYAGKLDESALVYYVTDDYSLWPGAHADSIRQASRELTRRADLILVCSESLAASHQNQKAKTVLLPHAVDFEHFTHPRPEPEELKSVPHPRACFFGLIYEKIDLDSLYDLAVQEPQLQLVLIGPVKTNVNRLSGLPNVQFLGPKPYADLPAYLQAMDVLVVPYVTDDEIQASSPLKIRECLALGKPTVTRALPDLVPLADVLHLYHHRDELVPIVRQVLAKNHNGQAITMRQRVKNETWQARVETIHRELCFLNKTTVEISSDPPAWDEYLSQNPHATLFHDPGWGQVMQAAYNNTPYYLTARRDGRVVGLLQLIRQKSLLFGSRLTSLPYFDASGILTDNERTNDCLLAETQKLARRERVKWVELRQRTTLPGTLPTRTDKVDLRLQLPAGRDELWNHLDAKVRNQIRKAQSANLTVESGQNELLNDFHVVYTRTMRDLGSPPHHRRFFEQILKVFSEHVLLFIVRSSQTPLAAAFTLIDRNTLYVPWAAADWRFKHQCPNMLLYGSMLAHGADRGLNSFDFGRSTRDSGAYRFKKQWGAMEYPLLWQYVLSADQPLPRLRPDDARYRLLIRCWQRLPLALVRTLGPRLIGKLS